MKRCQGSIGGHPHGHVYYVDRKTKQRICHYCSQPVAGDTKSAVPSRAGEAPGKAQ